MNFKDFTKRLFGAIIPLLLLFSLVLTACGGAPANGGNQVDNSSAADNSANADNAGDTDDGGMDDMGGFEGTLRVAFQPIVQTDPALISSDAEVFVANAVYDYLVDIDPESNVIPRLAADWQVSDDGLTYTFNLVENARFHDGTGLTAADVVYTFNRLRDQDTDFATASQYAGIVDVQAEGDYTVVFTLDNPNPFFLYDLSDNHALVIKDGTEDPTDFNGTGPFVVEDYSPEDRITLAANPDYFVEGQPHLAKVEIIFFSDENAAVDALRGGQVDLVMRMSTSLFESLQGLDGITAVDIPTNGFDLVRVRADVAPFDDPKVQQALKLATDREAIFQLVQQGYGAVGNDSPIGPLFGPYHDPGAVPPARDVQAAIDLLAEAGYPDGLDVELTTPDTGGRPDLAAVIQQQWAEAGINVEIVVHPESVYYGENLWLEAPLGITGWGSRPYPQFYLVQMVRSDGVWNEAHWANDELDALIDTAGSTLDEVERQAAYAQIQEIMASGGPIIIPYFFPQFGAIRDGFDGWEMKAFPGRTDLRGISLAE